MRLTFQTPLNVFGETIAGVQVLHSLDLVAGTAIIAINRIDTGANLKTSAPLAIPAALLTSLQAALKSGAESICGVTNGSTTLDTTK